MDETSETMAQRAEKARAAAKRLVRGAFRRDGERLEGDCRPRFSIPCRPEHDDDTSLMKFIDDVVAANAQLERERDEAVNSLFTLRNRAGCGPEQSGPDVWAERDAALARVRRLEGLVERATACMSTSAYPTWHDDARAALDLGPTDALATANAKARADGMEAALRVCQAVRDEAKGYHPDMRTCEADLCVELIEDAIRAAKDQPA